MLGQGSVCLSEISLTRTGKRCQQGVFSISYFTPAHLWAVYASFTVIPPADSRKDGSTEDLDGRFVIGGVRHPPCKGKSPAKT